MEAKFGAESIKENANVDNPPVGEFGIPRVNGLSQNFVKTLLDLGYIHKVRGEGQ